ncbi:MAG TPA: hypothetical protein VLF89_02650 [Candidatus Saccharimonadales bacterium]|nr:hypothetical protein [Candidatus Saccharimonadales bacterium]
MSNKTSFERIISAIEIYCIKQQLNHRFVGGVSFGGLLNEKTSAEIDIDAKTIKLKRHNKETLLRNDKTIRDIDVIFFCNNKNKINKFASFITDLRKSHGNTGTFPDISYEPTIYPHFGKRNHFSQFVTALEVDEENNLYLAFDDVQQKISWESIEPWTVILEDGLTFTVRNPIADYYAYIFRSPAGPKPKDEKKLRYVKKLAEAVVNLGKAHNPQIDYESQLYYGSWQKYIEKLNKTENPVTNTKKFWLKVYWQTIGTLFAHIFTRSGNNFTGVKQ